jgi:hypothetical protein
LATLDVLSECRLVTEVGELSSAPRLCQAIADAEEAGCDEFIHVPGTVDPRCLATWLGSLRPPREAAR